MKKILLVGNPNTGKTTLFNSLTQSSEHTGNWHGVTVAEKEKTVLFEGEKLTFVDLPGLYSLNAVSAEEQVAIDYIFSQKYDLIIFACDAFAMRKNLFLAVELLLWQKTNLVFAINNMGKKNLQDFSQIKTMLGTDFFCGDFSKKEFALALGKHIKNCQNFENKINFFEEVFSKNLQEKIIFLAKKFDLKNIEIIKIFEENNYFLLKKNKNKIKLNNFCKNNKKTKENIIQEKYNFIDKILPQKNSKKHILGKENLDRFFLNKFFAIPIFFGIMTLVFYLTFFGVGAFLSEQLSYGLEAYIFQPFMCWFRSICDVPWVIGLVGEGVLAGAVSLAQFLPQIVMLFLCLAIMEETGYFARVAFMFEDIFSSVGLSGKSVYTLLMGFGCSASAILTTRALDARAVKIKTALATPYMSCSAKLPIYAVLGGAFFGASNVFVIFFLYLIGVFSSLLISAILDKFLPNKNTHFLMEFPPYRFPKAKKILALTFENMKLFLLKIATIFVSMSIIIWCLGNFDTSLRFIGGESAESSILWCIGSVIAPIFAPLGFDNWGAAGALISGIVAKEIVVSSILIVSGASGFDDLAKNLYNPENAVCFTSASMLSFLTFCLLYTPCLASIAVLKKEIGWKWTIFAVCGQILFAYVMSFVVINIYKLGEMIGVLNLLLALLAIFAVIFAVLGVVHNLKKPDKCKLCGKCGR